MLSFESKHLTRQKSILYIRRAKHLGEADGVINVT